MKMHIPLKKSSRSVRKSHGKLAFGLAAIASLSLGVAASHATTFTYTNTLNPLTTNGESTQWASGTHWSAPLVSGSDTTLVFAGTCKTQYANSNYYPVYSKDDLGDASTPFQLNTLTLAGSNPQNYTTVTYNIQPLNSATNTLAFVANNSTAPIVNLDATNGNYGNAVSYNVSINATIEGTLTFQGSGKGGFNYSGKLSDGASTGSIVKTGASTLSLAGANSFTGGVTLNQGQLNINNATALGDGTFTMASGVKIDNTSAAAITNSKNNAQVWNGDFTFVGSKNLNLGNGDVTLNANSAITVTSGTLTVGGSIAENGGNYGLTKLGVGTLVLNGASSSYSGPTIVKKGLLQVASVGSLGGTGQNVTVLYGAALATGVALSNATLGEILMRLTPDSAGTITQAIDSSNNLDFSVASAPLGLGSAGTTTYSGVLTPKDGVYRLGGGTGTLNFNSALTGVGNRLVVDGNGTGGTVTLQVAATHGGGTTVTSAQTGSYGVLQTNILSDVSTTPFGANPAITLDHGALGVGTAGSLTAGQSVTASGYDVSFKGQSSIQLKAGAGSATFAANSLTRVGGGVMVLAPTGTLGVNEIVTVASGAPTVNNGMVAPYYINGTTQSFVTYDAVNGFKDVTYKSVAVTGSGAGSIWTATAADNVSIDNNTDPGAGYGKLTINSLRLNNTNTWALGFGQGAGDVINVLSGGVIYYGTKAGGSLNWSTGGGLNLNHDGVFYVASQGANVNLPIYSPGGFTKAGDGSLSVGNLQATGGVTIAAGQLAISANNGINPNNTITIENGASLGVAGFSAGATGLIGSGIVSANNNATLTIDSVFGSGTSVFTGSITNSAGAYNVTKKGLSTQVLGGFNTYTGATTVNGGVLSIDFSTANAPGSNIVNYAANSSKLVLGGGRLEVVGNNSVVNSQQFNGLAVNAGYSKIKATSGVGGTTNVTLGGTFTRAAGSAMDFVLPSSGSITTAATTNLSNGVLVSAATNGVAFATVNGADWATVSGGTIGAFSSYNVDDFAAGNNVNVTTNSSPDTFTVNTLRFNTADVTLALTGANTVSTGGILVGNNGGNVSINGGDSIAAGGGNELNIINNGQLTVSSKITGTGKALTLSGIGTTTISGANDYTGSTNINSGIIVAGDDSAFGTTGAINLNGGTLQAGGGARTFSQNVALQNLSTIGGANDLTFSGAFTAPGSSNLVVNNAGLTTFSGAFVPVALAGTGNVLVSGPVTGTAGFTYVGSGTLSLTNATSTFSGGNRISSGVVSVNSLSDEATSGISTTINGANTLGLSAQAAADLQATGVGVGANIAGTGIAANTTILAISGTNVTLSQNATASGINSLTFGTATASSIGQSTTAASNLVIDGGTFQYTGDAVSTNRAFSIGHSGGTVDASGSGPVNFTNTGTLGNDNDISADRTLTLTGANTGDNTLAAVVADNIVGKTSLTKSGAGKWVLSGANTYTGNTTITNGTLSLGATGSINNSAKITVQAGATLDLGGLSGVTIGSAQTLEGTGTVTAPTSGALVVSGTLAPGENSIGTLEVIGSLTLAGTTVIDINKSGALLSSDHVNGATTLTLGGALIVNWSGDVLAGGDAFTLFSSTNFTGSFDSQNIVLPTLGSGLSWDTSKLGVTGDILVVPEPATWALMVGGLGMFAFCNRLRRQRRS